MKFKYLIFCFLLVACEPICPTIQVKSKQLYEYKNSKGQPIYKYELLYTDESKFSDSKVLYSSDDFEVGSYLKLQPVAK